MVAETKATEAQAAAYAALVARLRQDDSNRSAA
jgi:hypothetical protein